MGNRKYEVGIYADRSTRNIVKSCNWRKKDANTKGTFMSNTKILSSLSDFEVYCQNLKPVNDPNSENIEVKGLSYLSNKYFLLEIVREKNVWLT